MQSQLKEWIEKFGEEKYRSTEKMNLEPDTNTNPYTASNGTGMHF